MTAVLEKVKVDFSGATAWFGGASVSGTDLIGQVAVVHFWCGAEMASMRWVPWLSAWQKHYGSVLAVVGVHVPRLEAEQERGFLAKTMARFGVGYTVAADWHGAMRRRFGVGDVPAAVVVDARGAVRGVFGGSEMMKVEGLVRTLLQEVRKEVPEECVRVEGFGGVREGARVSAVSSPALALGGAYNDCLGSPERVVVGAPTRFTSVKHPAEGMFYLEGVWEIDGEAVTSCSAGAAVHAVVSGSEISAFLEAQSRCEMTIEIDGVTLSSEAFGMSIAPDSKGVVPLRSARLYHLAQGLAGEGSKVLTLRFSHAGARVFCVEAG